MTRHLPLLAGLVSVTALLASCAEKAPARFTLDPAGPLRFHSAGQEEQLRAAAFDAKGAPFAKKVPATFTSSDATVATVDASGKVVSVSSGKAKVEATAWGLTSSVDVEVRIVDRVELAPTTLARMKLHGDDQKLGVVVKDDKGNIILDPAVSFRAPEPCVDVNDDGVVHAQAVGECDVVVSSAGKSARLKLAVVD
jgi:hypothetical protein